MGQIPYGYRIENGAAVIIPAEAAQIRLIFQNYIAGMSLQSAARAAGAENPNIDSGFYCLPVTFREVFFVNKVLVFFCFSQDLKKTVYK